MKKLSSVLFFLVTLPHFVFSMESAGVDENESIIGEILPCPKDTPYSLLYFSQRRIFNMLGSPKLLEHFAKTLHDPNVDCQILVRNGVGYPCFFHQFMQWEREGRFEEKIIFTKLIFTKKGASIEAKIGKNGAERVKTIIFEDLAKMAYFMAPRVRWVDKELNRGINQSAICIALTRFGRFEFGLDRDIRWLVKGCNSFESKRFFDFFCKNSCPFESLELWRAMQTIESYAQAVRNSEHYKLYEGICRGSVTSESLSELMRCFCEGSEFYRQALIRSGIINIQKMQKDMELILLRAGLLFLDPPIKRKNMDSFKEWFTQLQEGEYTEKYRMDKFKESVQAGCEADIARWLYSGIPAHHIEGAIKICLRPNLTSDIRILLAYFISDEETAELCCCPSIPEGELENILKNWVNRSEYSRRAFLKTILKDTKEKSNNVIEMILKLL